MGWFFWGYPYGTIVHLLILTGQRKTEIANLGRTWIDQKARTITLPEWVCKNSREHTFPYGDMVAAELEMVPRLRKRRSEGPCITLLVPDT